MSTIKIDEHYYMPLAVCDLLSILVTLWVSILPSLVDWVLTGLVAIALFEMMRSTLRAGIRSLFLD